MAIIEQEVRPLEADGLSVTVPDFMTEIVAEISQHGAPVAARQPALGRVGASVDRELRDAGRQRHPARARRTASARSCPASATSTRSSSSTSGKIEIETLDDGRERRCSTAS